MIVLRLPIKFFAWKASDQPQVVENNQSHGLWDVKLIDHGEDSGLEIVWREGQKRILDRIFAKSIKEVEFPTDARFISTLPCLIAMQWREGNQRETRMSVKISYMFMQLETEKIDIGLLKLVRKTLDKWHVLHGFELRGILEGHGLPPSFVQLTGIQEPQPSRRVSKAISPAIGIPSKRISTTPSSETSTPSKRKRNLSTRSPLSPSSAPLKNYEDSSLSSQRRLLLGTTTSNGREVTEDLSPTPPFPFPSKPPYISRLVSTDSQESIRTPVFSPISDKHLAFEPSRATTPFAKVDNEQLRSISEDSLDPTPTEKYLLDQILELKELLAKKNEQEKEKTTESIPLRPKQGNKVIPTVTEQYLLEQIMGLRRSILEKDTEIQRLKSTITDLPNQSDSKSKSRRLANSEDLTPTVTEAYLLEHIVELRKATEEKDLKIKDLEQRLAERTGTVKSDDDIRVSLQEVWNKLNPLLNFLHAHAKSPSLDDVVNN